MKTRVDTYLCTCDSCKTTAIHHGSAGLPDGWFRLTRDVKTGFTEYYEGKHACGFECMKKCLGNKEWGVSQWVTSKGKYTTWDKGTDY